MEDECTIINAHKDTHRDTYIDTHAVTPEVTRSNTRSNTPSNTRSNTHSCTRSNTHSNTQQHAATRSNTQQHPRPSHLSYDARLRRPRPIPLWMMSVAFDLDFLTVIIIFLICHCLDYLLVSQEDLILFLLLYVPKSY